MRAVRTARNANRHDSLTTVRLEPRATAALPKASCGRRPPKRAAVQHVERQRNWGDSIRQCRLIRVCRNCALRHIQPGRERFVDTPVIDF